MTRAPSGQGSRQPMPLPGWTEEPLPEGVAPGRYRLYRRPVGT